MFIKHNSDKPLEPTYISRTEIQNLISTLIWNSEEKLEEMMGVQKVIDRVFYTHTRKFFLAQIVIFVLGFVTPFLYSVFTKNVSALATSYTVCSITMAGIVVLEFMDILKNGREYFSSIWNFVDFTFIICWYLYYFIKVGENFDDFS